MARSLVLAAGLVLLGGCKCGGTGSPPHLPAVAYFAVSEALGPQIWRWVPDAGARQVTRGPALHVPIAARGGRLLAARVVPAEEREQLGWLSDDGEFRPLTPLLPRARHPSWVGARVAYESGAAGLSNVALVDGARDALLTDAPLGDFEPSLGPDGGFVVFVSSRTGDPELYAQCLDCDGGPRRLTEHPREDTSPVVSPDGARVAFLSNRDGVDQLYVLELGTAASRRVSVRGAATPRWSPDGRTLYFTQVDGPESTQLAAVDLGAGAERLIGASGLRDTLDSVSDDGRWLGTTRALARGSQVALVASDGGVRVPLSPDDGREAWGVVLSASP